MKFVEAQSALVESNELDNESLYMQLKTKSYLGQGGSVGACSRQLYKEKLSCAGTGQGQSQ